MWGNKEGTIKEKKKKAKCLHSVKCYGNSPVVPICNNLNEYHLKHHTD